MRVSVVLRSKIALRGLVLTRLIGLFACFLSWRLIFSLQCVHGFLQRFGGIAAFVRVCQS